MRERESYTPRRTMTRNNTMHPIQKEPTSASDAVIHEGNAESYQGNTESHHGGLERSVVGNGKRNSENRHDCRERDEKGREREREKGNVLSLYPCAHRRC